MALQRRFDDLLVRAAAELYEDQRDRMRRPDLIPTGNAIHDADLVLFFEGLDCGLIRLERGGRFNTLDRRRAGGGPCCPAQPRRRLVQRRVPAAARRLQPL